MKVNSMQQKNLPAAPLISAHRGGRQEAPENTVAAFQRAVALDISGAECDVHLSADAIPVVIHDGTVDRTTNGTGEVHTMTAAELAALDARDGFPDWPERTGIPTFAEVLQVARAFDTFAVEIKPDAPERIDTLVPLLLDDIDAAGARDTVAFISFDPGILEVCHRLAPGIPLALLTLETTPKEIQAAIDLGCTDIGSDVRTLTRESIDVAHEAGLRVTAWTVNAADDFARLCDWGVDAVTTDRPTHMRTLLQARRAAG